MILISKTATISDVDSSSFQVGELRVDFRTGGNASDRLSIRTAGTAAGEINTSATVRRLR